MLSLGGLPAILGGTMLDEKTPYLREWSILAIRNICLFNERNRDFLSSLQAQEIPEHVRREMAKKGIDLTVAENGKVHVRQIAREDLEKK